MFCSRITSDFERRVFEPDDDGPRQLVGHGQSRPDGDQLPGGTLEADVENNSNR